MSKNSNVQILISLLHESQSIVAFTGAGISTESGIPDFRGTGGVWTRYKPIEFQDFLSSEEKRQESWKMKLELDAVMKKAEPNEGHKALSTLHSLGKNLTLITQNIDGLHQLSGVPTEKIIELHGNSTYATCLDCKKRYEIEDVKVMIDSTGKSPTCSQCGGYIKTATISFGQPMPVEEMNRAETASLECDLFMAIGSSLVVYPAAGFPVLAKENGSKLIIINRDPTPLDSIADLVVNEEIGDVFKETIAGLKR